MSAVAALRMDPPSWLRAKAAVAESMRKVVWQKRMDDFMEESVNLIESETQKVAKEKGLDMVVVQNPLTKTVRYTDGEDLTLDVSLELQKK